MAFKLGRRPQAPTELYSSEFYVREYELSRSAASVVVPLVLALVPARNVVDVGCGIAPWAAEFLANGVEEVWGIDGDYVDRALLRIPRDRFLAQDLTKQICFDRKVDLAVCLEVAEHLPESRADGLVADLTGLAPCVLFSAGMPEQGGVNHLNEQYLPYWVELFKRRTYLAVDIVRPQILGNEAVAWWYQQNIVIFAAPGHPILDCGPRPPWDIVHQELYEQLRTRPLTLREILVGFPSALRSSIRHHLGI
jgi:SAM-dependent methyltransferase